MSAIVLSYTVNARVVGTGVALGAVEGKTAEVEFDTSAGQSQSLPGPADLLVMAFAACVLKNVERMSQMLPFRYEGASITVTAEREQNPPRMARIQYRLDVLTNEPQRRLDLLHRNIASKGTIYNTLARTCEVSGEIVAVAATYE
jgi:uncharacterized OsmC-like protein